ncbi:MAG: ABC transporter ATP-binding protein [Clostridia bacterium]|nr:ABC transporter ATP-binding protein [Clostridia bacterium]
MKHLFGQLKRFRAATILAPLLKLAEALLELIVPLIVAKIVDDGIGGGDRTLIVRASLFLVLIGFVGLLFSVTAQYFAARAAVGATNGLRRELFRHATGLPFKALDEIGAPTLVTRLTGDVNQVRSGVNLGLRLLLRSPFIVFGALIMAFTVDARSALIFSVMIPVLFLVAFAVTLTTIPLYRRSQAKLDRVVGLTRENLTGVRVIRAFGREDAEVDRFRRESEELSSLNRFVGRISALLNPLTYVVVNLAVIVLLRTGAIRIDAGNLSQGELIALYNYLSQILVELLKLTSLVITINRSLASAKRIGEILDRRDALDSLPEETPDRATPDHVVFRGVSLTYPGAAGPALSGIDLSVGRGEKLGIIGGTGSGKSTLTGLIPHFLDATEGQVLVDGIDVRAYDTDALRRGIGIVLQEPLLFSGSVRDNLKMANPDATDAEMESALATAQILDAVNEKGGLDAKIEQGGRNFSGGQRQRLAVARALVRRPEILILDDSSSALDYQTDARLRAAIAALPEKTTVLTISQRTSSLRDADRIAVLDEGRLVGLGTHEELLATCPVYAEIDASQNADGKEGAV